MTHRRKAANAIAALVGLLLAGCQAVGPPPEASIAPTPTPGAVRAPAAPAPPAPSAVPASPARPETPVRPPAVATWSARGITFEGVAFDARSHRLIVVDQPDGPGTRHATAAGAARAAGGIAAVNAGFFTPEGEPLGLVVASGNVAGNWNNASSLGAGVWHEDAAGRQKIVRREALRPAAARSMSELLQSGPMLVEDGRVVRGLGDGEPRPRTCIAWDGGHRWWIGRAGPCSLPGLAAALVAGDVPGSPGFAVRHALNLDGGRSSEMWAGESVAGGPLARRPLWNRSVRNHLVLVPAPR